MIKLSLDTKTNMLLVKGLPSKILHNESLRRPNIQQIVFT